MKIEIKYAVFEWDGTSQWTCYSDYYDTEKEAQDALSALDETDMNTDSTYRYFKIEKLYAI